MKEQIEVLRKAVVDLCAVINRNGTHIEYTRAWRDVERATNPEFLLTLIGLAEAKLEGEAQPELMNEQVERFRKAALGVIDATQSQASARDYHRAWTELERATDPHMILALIAQSSSNLAPEEQFKLESAGFYALVCKESGEIARIEYADDPLAAEVILHAHLRLEQKALTVVEKVSVRRYVSPGSI